MIKAVAHRITLVLLVTVSFCFVQFSASAKVITNVYSTVELATEATNYYAQAMAAYNPAATDNNPTNIYVSADGWIIKDAEQKAPSTKKNSRALKFVATSGSKNTEVISPYFPGRILSVELWACSSSIGTDKNMRVLTISPYIKKELNEELSVTFETNDENAREVPRSMLYTSGDNDVRKFKLHLTGPGRSPTWDLVSVTVVCEVSSGFCVICQ